MSTALTKAEHEQQAAHNERFTAALLAGGNAYLDWVVTGYFYAALHWAEAYFHARGAGFTSHPRRNQEVAARFPPAERVRYLTLYSYSRLARYDSVSVDRVLHDDALHRQFLPLKGWLLPQL